MEKLSQINIIEKEEPGNTHEDVPLRFKLLSNICPLHKEYSADSLCIHSDQDSLFKCILCITDEGIHQNTLIPLQQIASATETTVFANFPFTDHSLTSNVKTIMQNPPNTDSLKSEIDQFFKDLRVRVLGKIDCMEAEMLVTAQSISDMSSEIIEMYNQMSQKEKMQSIVTNDARSLPDKQRELKEVCTKVIGNNKENARIMSRAIEEIYSLQQSINFEYPKQIKEEILKNIEKIDMFSKRKEIQTFTSMTSSDNQTSLKKNIIDMINEISTSNDALSDETYQILKEYLTELLSLLQKAVASSPKQENYLRNLRKLITRESEFIKQFFENNSQINQAGDEYLLIEKSDFSIRMQDHLHKLEQDSKKYQISSSQQKEMSVYQPIQQNQKNSAARFKSRKIDLSFFDPTFIQSNSTMKMNFKHQELELASKAKRQSQCNSLLLNNNDTYQLKLKFNRPYGKADKGHFRIGLIKDELSDYYWVLSDSKQAGFISQEGEGAQIIVRGGKLSNEKQSQNTCCLEFRWCISKQLFFISDSAHMNINQVSQELINPYQEYRFAIFFNQLDKSDWKITITEFKTIDPQTISMFH